MSVKYGISELAKEFNITTRTIRFYEDIGILSPTRKGTHRIYDQKDRTLLKLTLRGKRLGLPLNECKELFELYDPVSENNEKQLQTCLHKFQAQRAKLQIRLNDATAMILELDNTIVRVKEAILTVK